MATVSEFVSKFSIQINQASVDNFTKSTKSIEKGLGKLPFSALKASTAIGIFAGVLGASARSLAHYGSNLSNLSQSLDTPVTKLAILEQAARESGMGIQAAIKPLSVLQSQLAQIQTGKGINAQFAGLLGNLSRLSGVSLRPVLAGGHVKAAGDFYSEVQNAISKLPTLKMRVAFDQKLGFGNQEPIRARLARSRSLIAGAAISPATAAKSGQKVQASLADLGFQFQQLALILGTDLLPVIRGFAKFLNFFNHKLVKGTKQSGNDPAYPPLVGFKDSPLGKPLVEAGRWLVKQDRKNSPYAMSQASAVSPLAFHRSLPPLLAAQNNSPIPRDIAAPSSNTNNTNTTYNSNVHFNNTNAILPAMLQPELG